jgi:hypothetical protein
MTERFCEQLDVFTHRATESEVMLTLCDMSRGRIRSFRGELRGPRCLRAKTLQAGFTVTRCECETNVSCSTSLVVTEPCYWTPELPMLYDLNLELELADGSTLTWQTPVGLRRWEIHGRDFFREGKRVVLRGLVIDDCSRSTLERAAEAEVTLVVRDPSNEILDRASELGVPVVVDFRGFSGELTRKLLSYAWQPAVALVLLDDEMASGFYQPAAVKTGGYFDGTEPPRSDWEWVNVVACELEPSEQLLSWAANYPKPVIAIRRGGAYVELAAARQGCDLLQAKLAPNFDLAGYFV